MRPPRLALPATIVAAALLAACSSSHDSGSRATTTTSAATPTTSSAVTTSTTVAGSTTSTAPIPTTTQGSSVRILSLTGPPSPVECNAPTSIELHWDTRGAATVELRIDNDGVFATYPGGKSDKLVPLACDGKAQTYQLTARGANGETANKVLTIGERAST